MCSKLWRDQQWSWKVYRAIYYDLPYHYVSKYNYHLACWCRCSVTCQTFSTCNGGTSFASHLKVPFINYTFYPWIDEKDNIPAKPNPPFVNGHLQPTLSFVTYQNLYHTNKTLERKKLSHKFLRPWCIQSKNSIHQLWNAKTNNKWFTKLYLSTAMLKPMDAEKNVGGIIGNGWHGIQYI